jgi:hypothetical protein
MSIVDFIIHISISYLLSPEHDFSRSVGKKTNNFVYKGIMPSTFLNQQEYSCYQRSLHYIEILVL